MQEWVFIKDLNFCSLWPAVLSFVQSYMKYTKSPVLTSLHFSVIISTGHKSIAQSWLWKVWLEPHLACLTVSVPRPQYPAVLHCIPDEAHYIKCLWWSSSLSEEKHSWKHKKRIHVTKLTHLMHAKYLFSIWVPFELCLCKIGVFQVSISVISTA